MTRAQRIETTLRQSLSPRHFELRDTSASHAGHSGARPGGETHYHLTVVSDAFTGLSRIERHRLVNTALQGEFDSGLHALQLVLQSPQERGEPI